MDVTRAAATRAAVGVLAGGLALGGVVAGPARADEAVPVDPAAVSALVSTWQGATRTSWDRDGGTFDQRCVDAQLAHPGYHRRLLLDPSTRSFREHRSEHGHLPSIEVVRGRHRADRTVKEIRAALRRHHVRPVPAWTSTTLSPNAAAGRYDRASSPWRSLPSPAGFRWTALSATTAGDGSMTFTGSYERWTDGASTPFYSATLTAVADRLHRLVSWVQSGQNAGSFGGPPTELSCQLTWQWERAVVALPDADRSSRRVVRTESRLRDEVAILADTVNQHVAQDGPVTVRWLQQRFATRHTSPIRNGLRFTREVRGSTLAWKVVLHHDVASYRVAAS